MVIGTIGKTQGVRSESAPIVAAIQRKSVSDPLPGSTGVPKVVGETAAGADDAVAVAGTAGDAFLAPAVGAVADAVSEVTGPGGVVFDGAASAPFHRPLA